MRLHRIHVENFKSVSDRTLELPDRGLVIAEGLNEVGKTSMVEALDLLIDSQLKATSKASRVRQAQPYGTDLPVVVEAEMTIRGVRLVHSKRFLAQPQARLEFLAGDRAGEVLTGEEATDAMAEIWKKTDPTLWRALRLMQAGSLEALSLQSSTALTKALDQAVHGGAEPDEVTDGDTAAASSGQSLAQPDAAPRADGESLLETVRQVYEQYWTPTGKPGKAVKDATTAQGTLREQHRQAKDHLVEVDAVVADLEETQEDVESQQRAVARLGNQVTADEAAVTALEGLERAATEAGRAEKDARTRCDTAVQALKDRREAVEELETARQDEKRSLDSATRADRVVEEVEQRFREADEGWRQAEETRRQSKEAWDAARAKAGALRDRSRLDKLSQTVERLSGLVADLHAAESRLDANPATAPLVAKAQKADEKLTAAHIRLETASPRMTLARLAAEAPDLTIDGEPLQAASGDDARAHTDGAEASGAEAKTAAAPIVDRAVDRPTVVEIAGAWRITVTPASDVDDLARQVEKAERALATALEEMASSSLDEARERLDQRTRDEGEVTGLRERLRRELEDARSDLGLEPPKTSGDPESELTLSDLITQRDRIAASVQPVERDATTEKPEENVTAEGIAEEEATEATKDSGARESLPQAEQRALELEAVHEEAELAEKTARSARDTVSEQRSKAREKASGAASALRAAHEQVAKREDRLDSARARISDEELEQSAGQAAETHRDAKEKATRTASELAEHAPEEVRSAASDSAQRLVRAKERLARSKDRRAGLAGQLKGLDREGRQDRFDELDGLLHRSTIETTALTKRAGAAKLLYETLVRHRDEEHRRYLEPFTREIERLGRAVFGRDMAVRVDDSLTVTERRLNGAWLGWDQLSTGAKEQLGLVVRLATAQLVDPTDGVPVILDDALVYSDRVRTARLLQEVATGSRTHQVIVLTSAPERYDGLDAVHIPFQ